MTKIQSKKLKDIKKIKYQLPYTFMLTTSLCPEITKTYYEFTNCNNYEKYCKTVEKIPKIKLDRLDTIYLDKDKVNNNFLKKISRNGFEPLTFGATNHRSNH